MFKGKLGSTPSGSVSSLLQRWSKSSFSTCLSSPKSPTRALKSFSVPTNSST
ncbi:hypothetical protein LguiB_017813 [Lonicera macranthoides]